jgi:hypothetical protein
MAPITVLTLTVGASPSTAAPTAVDLGTAGSFGVLAGSTVTNTGPSVITGDLGVSPGTAVTGFPPGTVLGTVHAADPVALQAQSDLKVAYDTLAGQASDETISADLGGRTLTTGVYSSGSSMGLTGELTLDAQGDPTALFIFQVGSGLTTASGSDIILTNGARACNVYWQVGSSATLGTGSAFTGTIVTLTSISAATGATIDGRLLARNGAVTLDTNNIAGPGCDSSAPDTGGTDTGGTDTGGTDTGGTDTGGSDTGGTDTGGTDTGGTDTGGTDTGGTDTGSSGDTLTGTDTTATGDTGVKDSTTNQVAVVPRGLPATGDGGSVHGSSLGLLGGGSLALLVACGLLVWWRLETARD